MIAFHQAVAALLFALGITERIPYSTQPTAPFGVPQLWSIAFWGGVWGALLAASPRRLDGARLIPGRHDLRRHSAAGIGLALFGRR